MAESALADKEVRGGDRLALMRRALRLGKPPRRWKPPAWVCQLPCEPPEVQTFASPLCGCALRCLLLLFDARQVAATLELPVSGHADPIHVQVLEPSVWVARPACGLSSWRLDGILRDIGHAESSHGKWWL